MVELRIFECAGTDKKDITFCYSANFFLYATLETCRPIAHGRMPGAPQQQPAVLTGMPVSGMAYLDRPQEAGYFIFPDLSVRHEGRYKLSFNLYEETKEERDFDADPSHELRGPAGSSGSFDWRLEVKSVPFTVYSAKKFPGLAESTALSRTVAEQGCRVRIRRDVRMRRRDGKADDNYDDDEFSRARRTPSPVESVHQVYSRQRSLSVDNQSYGSERRASMEQYPQQYSSGYAPAPAAPAPPTQFAPPSHFPQHAAYPPAPPTPQQQRYAPPPPSGPVPASQGYYQPEYPRSGQPTADSYASRDQYEAQMREKTAYEKQVQEDYYRRSSVGYAPAPPPPPPAQFTSYPQRRESVPYPPSQQYAPRAPTPVGQPPVSLAPLKMPPIEPKYETLSSPVAPLSGGPRMSVAPQLPSPASFQERSSYGNYSVSVPPTSAPETARNGKRPYEEVFRSSASAYNHPLHNGMRPDHQNIVQAATFDDDEDTIDMEALKMSYKRADGHLQERELPTLR